MHNPLVRKRPLWKCPACRRLFANRNQSHSCGRYSLQSHLRNKSLSMRLLYESFVAEVRQCGPVKILPEKTRIAFQVRMSFAAVVLQSSQLIGHLVLAERNERPCFHKIDSISPRNHVHHFRISKPEDFRSELRHWLREAYAVGEQRHLRRSQG